MKSRKESKRSEYPRKVITLSGGRTADENGEAFAQLITSPEFASHRIIKAMQPKEIVEQIDIPGLLAILRDQARTVSSGDLSRVESLLMNQADALQSLFVGLVERSLRQEYHVHMEGIMRLALKAQSQCRATLETLAAVKNPPVVYARQANVTSGPQQINNGVDLSRVRENVNAPNQLSGAVHELRQDTRASGAASAVDSSVEAMASVNGAKNGGG
jgi:hypothetical protein